MTTETIATETGPVLLTVNQAAARLGLSIWTVYQLMDSGRIADSHHVWAEAVYHPGGR